MLQFDVKNKRKNPFLKREDLDLIVKHEGQSTPKKDDLIKEIAKKFNSVPEKVTIDFIFSETGIARSRVRAKVWEDKPPVRKVKKGEKPKEEAKPEEAPKEEVTEEKKEEIKEPEKPKEEKPEKKPEETSKEEKPEKKEEVKEAEKPEEKHKDKKEGEKSET